MLALHYFLYNYCLFLNIKEGEVVVTTTAHIRFLIDNCGATMFTGGEPSFQQNKSGRVRRKRSVASLPPGD